MYFNMSHEVQARAAVAAPSLKHFLKNIFWCKFNKVLSCQHEWPRKLGIQFIETVFSTWVASQARHTVPRYWLVNISDLVSSVHFFFVIIVWRYCHLWLQISLWFNSENFSHKFSGNSDIWIHERSELKHYDPLRMFIFVFCSYSKFFWKLEIQKFRGDICKSKIL